MSEASGNGQCDVLILGAGLSGLVCAYRAAQRGARVVVVDPAPRVGGVVRSERVDDFLLEYGPNSFGSAPHSLQLLKELDLEAESEVLPMKEHDRYIWRAGKLRKVPTSPAQFATAECLSVIERLQVVAGAMKSVPPPSHDITLGQYFRQRLGDGFVEAMLKPGLAGIYAADADNVSFEAALPKVWAHAKIHARLLDLAKAMGAERSEGEGDEANPAPRSIIAPLGGMEALVTRLREKAETAGAELLLRRSVQLTRSGFGWDASLNSGRTLSAANIVLAVPAYVAAAILESLEVSSGNGSAPSPAAAAELREIKYASMAVVHVGAEESSFAEKRSGFGFLTMREQGVRALGIIWSDRMFRNRAPDGHRLLTCFYGGQIDPDAADLLDDEELQRQVLEDLRTTMGYQGGEPRLLKITRMPHALPLFPLGHTERMQTIEGALPACMHLLGNYTGGVSIPDRIAAAEKLAAELAGGEQAERIHAPQ